MRQVDGRWQMCDVRCERAGGVLQYCVGVACLGASELGYAGWMGVSLAAWWRAAPEAALARRGLDLLHDLKPALLAMQRYRDVVRPIYDMIEVTNTHATRMRMRALPSYPPTYYCFMHKFIIYFFLYPFIMKPIYLLELAQLLILDYFKFQEVEHEAPNNVFVIIVFGILGMILQVRDRFQYNSSIDGSRRHGRPLSLPY